MWGYKPKLDDALGYGKSLHYCLRFAGERIKQGEDPEKVVQKSIEEKFHRPYARPKPLENMKRSAEQVLMGFVRRHAEDMQRIEEVEARLEFPLDKATIAGRVDVIIKGPDGEPTIEVRDYKTSDVVTTFEEMGLQLQLYALGLKRLGRPVDCASVAYLDPKHAGHDIEMVSIAERELKAAKATAVESIKAIRAGVFKAIPGDRCDECDFKQICKWWSCEPGAKGLQGNAEAKPQADGPTKARRSSDATRVFSS